MTPGEPCGGLSSIQGDVSNIIGGVSNIRGDISKISGDVRNIKGDVSKIKSDLVYLIPRWYLDGHLKMAM